MQQSPLGCNVLNAVHNTHSRPPGLRDDQTLKYIANHTNKVGVIMKKN